MACTVLCVRSNKIISDKTAYGCKQTRQWWLDFRLVANFCTFATILVAVWSPVYIYIYTCKCKHNIKYSFNFDNWETLSVIFGFRYTFRHNSSVRLQNLFSLITLRFTLFENKNYRIHTCYLFQSLAHFLSFCVGYL